MGAAKTVSLLQSLEPSSLNPLPSGLQKIRVQVCLFANDSPTAGESTVNPKATMPSKNFALCYRAKYPRDRMLENLDSPQI